MKRSFFVTIIATMAFSLGLAEEDKIESDSKRSASLAFKYVQRHQNADGSYGAAASPLAVANTSLVIHALATSSWKYRESDGPFISKAVDFLLNAQNEDGSFGQGESKAGLTILALRSLIALQNPAYAERIDKAIAFVRQAIAPPNELRLGELDLNICQETVRKLWQADAEHALWASPKADIAMFAIAWELLRNSKSISDHISPGLKHYARLALVLSEPSLPKDPAAFHEMVKEIKAAQKQGSDADDDFGSIPAADAKALDGETAVSTALAGRAVDFVKSHYKKFVAAPSDNKN